MCRIFAAALLVAVLAACAPVTVSATLFGENARLHGVTVEEDKGASGDVVLIDIRGLIADRTPDALLGPKFNSIDELAARLKWAAQDPSVRAVILRINSPGGTVTSSDVMFREIRRFRAESGKPVVASLGEVAASGGYYIALAADRIIAEPTSITGSIGVIIPTLNFSEGLARIGIVSRPLVSGANKDMGDPLTPPREQHFVLLQAIVEEFYANFRSTVIDRRGAGRAPAPGGADHPMPVARALDMSRIDQLTDGRILTGRQACEAGIVDDTGGVREAFEAAKQLAGLKGARLVKYYREDSEAPRSAYAPTASAPGSAGGTEINLLQIRAGALSPSGALESGGAYYLWLPPG
jgi:protease IV